jgi:hypothetical protein
MKRSTILGNAILLILLVVPAQGQHHTSNWIHRTATDTTVVRCWTDSLTWLALPPNAMNMMMMPDSMYMRIELMKMDSLHISHDSTFIGWCRVQAGTDSMRFNMMNTDSISGTHNMMQFNMAMACQFRWDSLMSDSKHRSWHLTGMKGWNGSSWLTMPGVSITENTVRFNSGQGFSALAFVGVPSSPTAVAAQRPGPLEFTLKQNYPNPFNPTTTIAFGLLQRARVRLTVYNALGEQVAELTNGEQDAGYHEVKFDGTGLSSGAYFYRIQAGDFLATKRLLLLK